VIFIPFHRDQFDLWPSQDGYSDFHSGCDNRWSRRPVGENISTENRFGILSRPDRGQAATYVGLHYLTVPSLPVPVHIPIWLTALTSLVMC